MKDELNILPGIRSSLESALNYVHCQWMCVVVGHHHLVSKYIDEYCSLSLDSAGEAFLSEIKRLFVRWSSFLSSMYPMSASIAAYGEYQKNELCSSLGTLVQIIEQLKTGVG